GVVCLFCCPAKNRLAPVPRPGVYLQIEWRNPRREESSMQDPRRWRAAAWRAGGALAGLARWTLAAVLIGLLCGAVGSAFHLAVDTVTEWRAAYPQVIAALPVMGLAIVALYKATGTEGLGTNDVLDAVQDGKPVKPLLLPAIFLGTVLTHLAGGSAGREGAALQMGGDIGWQAGGLFRLADHERRTATLCGMAAFFTALFGTPLAA